MVKQLLNNHFEDQRDLYPLIQDLQMMRRLRNDSRLTLVFFLTPKVKRAQIDLIVSMAQNRLLTRVELKIAPIVQMIP